MALQPKAEVTRSPKQDYQWPQKVISILQKLFNKNSLPVDWNLKLIYQKISELLGDIPFGIFSDFVVVVVDFHVNLNAKVYKFFLGHLI